MSLGVETKPRNLVVSHPALKPNFEISKFASSSNTAVSEMNATMSETFMAGMVVLITPKMLREILQVVKI